MDFFSGSLRDELPGEVDAIREHARKKLDGYRNNSLFINLGFGEKIDTWVREWAGNKCWVNYGTTINRVGSDGTPKISKMFFKILDPPVRKNINPDCGVADGPWGEPLVDQLVMAYSLRSFLPLSDGTFLAGNDDAGVIFRFRPNLISPFIKNRKFFLVDTAEIDRLVEAAYARPGVPIKNANEAIHNYLLELRKESFK